MYKKVKKALDSLVIGYSEYEEVRFSNDIRIFDVFGLKEIPYYIAISEHALSIWNATGEYITCFIGTKEEQIFQLGFFLGNHA